MKTSSADSIDAVAISERAKEQIGSQAAKSQAKLQGPSFLEGFSDGGPAIDSNGVNLPTVHWKL
jgi:hypothetical protein